MVVEQVEIERKYDADADFVVPDLGRLPGVAGVGEAEVHSLHATYFDTDDLRLARKGITLRRRRGGADAGWHLKIPAGPDSKSELRAPLGRATVVPARLAALVAVHVRGRELRPVATLETERRVVRLLDEGGAMLAEVADDAVTGQVVDGRGEAWREIEVELGTDSPDLLKAAGKRLRKAGARKGSSKSKVGRLLGVQPEVEPVSEQVTAGDAVVAYLRAQVRAIETFDPKARLAEFDAVHRMRVATRRIRSVLHSYRPVLDRERTDPLRAELRWLAAELGEVRDLEVLRMRFTDRIDALEDAHHVAWLDELARSERGAYRRLNATLKQDRYFALLDALDALVTDPPLKGRAGRRAARELPKLVERAWTRLSVTFDSIEGAADPDVARHETRKVAKRARYAAEVAVPALGPPAKAVVKSAKRVQEVLGGYQDGVIATEHLREAARSTRDTGDAFTLGVLYGIERSEAAAWLAKVESTWEALPAPDLS